MRKPEDYQAGGGTPKRSQEQTRRNQMQQAVERSSQPGHRHRNWGTFTHPEANLIGVKDESHPAAERDEWEVQRGADRDGALRQLRERHDRMRSR